MIRILILATLALAACGGDDGSGDGGGGGDNGRRDIAPGLWEQDGEICATYHPHPASAPQVERTDCVPVDWPHASFCWRTDDDKKGLGYMCNDYSVAVGCYFIADRREVEKSAGSQSTGCVSDHQCIPHAIDNPVCCDEVEHDGSSVWDCLTN